MRKVVLLMSVSLDGFVARPDGDLSWLFPNMDADIMEWTFDAIRETDTQLMGRVTYEEQAQHWPSSTDELAPLINEAEKIVFSSKLSRLEWNNSRLAKRAVEEEVARLKEQSGKHIFVPGGARLAQSMSRLGLIDEYRLLVHPVALGSGLPLFADTVNLALQSSTTFKTGAVALTYERA